MILFKETKINKPKTHHTQISPPPTYPTQQTKQGQTNMMAYNKQK